MEMTNLTNNKEFIEWVTERKSLAAETQNEETLKKLWSEYQRELEYDVKLGF